MAGNSYRNVAELRLGREPDAVPRARRLARSALNDQWADIASDVELVISELVTNAILHGDPPIEVKLLASDRLRVEVHDQGREAPILLQRNTEAMTGRGLSMVSALSGAWGVEPAPTGGKVVWAEMGGASPGQAASAGRAGQDIEALLAAWSDDDDPPATFTVRLGAVSTELLLSAKAHIDNVVRELTLLREGEAARGRRLPADLEALVQSVTVDFAAARAEIKRQAAAAAARGDELTELELHLPPEVGDAGERYLAALDQADRYARASDLLTLAPPRVHRIFRQWYVGSVVEQLRMRARGVTPPPTRSFQVVLAEEVGRLEQKADVSNRLGLLQTVTAELVEAGGVEEMARIVVDNAIRFLGVETARVRMLGDDGVLRSVAWRSRDMSTPEPVSEYSIEADLPGARVARTGRPEYMRSIRQFLESDPRLHGQYPVGRSGHVVPLTVGEQTIGILSLTFDGGELSDDDEFAVVESLGGVLAQALRRAQLAERQEQQRQALTFLADALGILVSADDPAGVLERLVAHAVPRFADWCAVYLLDGGVLRRAAVAAAGLDGAVPGAGTDAILPPDLDIPHNRVLRSGRAETIGPEVGPLIESLYPDVDFSTLGVDWTRSSALCVPIELWGRITGVICVAFIGATRSVVDHAQEVLAGLAARVAIALEIAELRGRQRQPAERVVLDLAVGAGGIGTFDWDLVTGRLVWDARLLDMFGMDRNRSELSIEGFYDRVDPAYRDQVRDLVQQAIDTCGEFDAEYRIVLPDGGSRWVAARGRVLTDAGGRPVRLIGAAQDTTGRRDSMARISRAMDSMSTAFFFLDREWRFGYLNADAERVLGRPASELLGGVVWDMFPASVGSDFETFYRRAAETGESVSFDAFYPEPLNAWYEVQAWPHPEGLAVYFVDVTARRRAQEQAQRAINRARLLSRVTEELVAITDPEDAMWALARMIVPDLADWSVVTLIDDESQAGNRRGLRNAVAWHARPELRDAVNRYASVRLESMTDDAIVARAVESAEAQIIPDRAMDTLRGMFRPGEAMDLLEGLAPNAVAVLPLNGRRQAVGMLTLCSDSPEGFSEEDIDLARDVAARAGVVLDRARLYRQQREVAEALQRSLLSEPPDTDFLSVAVRYVPAAEAAQVGGDWYDAFNQQDGSVVLVIGDVMGHDLDAAAAMGQVRTLVRGIAAHSGSGPAEVLLDVEQTMQVLRMDTTATAVVARAERVPTGDGCRLRWSNAGHPPPIRVDSAGRTALLCADEADLLLGGIVGTPRQEHVIDVPAGSTVVFYTDGLVEQRDQPLVDGVARLERLLGDMSGADLEDLCDRVLQEMLPDRPDDDVALVAVRIGPPAG